MKLKVKERKSLTRKLFLALDILNAIEGVLKNHPKLTLREATDVLSKFNLSFRFKKVVWLDRGN